ncbi:uncharacterized protein [Physcomitrium patens]|uniref:Uncharacterized protein n=1 Tax=Physcomitrium patens TaxID=3218 RepID=A0A2K1JDB4_PHYPA|nr:uncharacterized protein LOC112292655 [Physcomitrium patens]XP_024397128.1 uncharacterized protein LOC112292655 [Physcomitrium patens]XP_024397129.1 uncharacterized protein LOC112292655 [Physcomitrium patens]XP_024397130.1 uncharacterized protein LOC112292655 [Physcomitrium patens]XP_024397131.1 uncharacterized protein LOC112292655 [Physcomitrium patens]XP_024397133.1 uncharacterized protein LOC112292655 [Physcomitrium patens]XP_024397134.1 uncharacterized protein LOC112292655 [Physcomitriu|eukprot:XP_024397127.1 uncharacterized protein LOC112292655 [Physcomitrella patens]
MALLQRCLPQYSSPILLTSKSIVKSSPSQCRPSLNCRASAGRNEHLRASHDEEFTSKPPRVFKDESNGIVCYVNEDGEITCEGWDEGPHFIPEPEKGYTMRKRITARPPTARGEGETIGFKASGAKMEESIREGTAEASFNSSEL